MEEGVKAFIFKGLLPKIREREGRVREGGGGMRKNHTNGGY